MKKKKTKEIKTSVTSRIDSDVVEWLKLEAEKMGIPYQTFMNSVLRQAMQGSLVTLKALRQVFREELKAAKKK